MRNRSQIHASGVEKRHKVVWLKNSFLVQPRQVRRQPSDPKDVVDVEVADNTGDVTVTKSPLDTGDANVTKPTVTTSDDSRTDAHSGVQRPVPTSRW